MAKRSTAIAAYSPTKGVVRLYKTRSHRRPKAVLSLAVLAGFAPTAVWAFKGFQEHGPSELATRVSSRLTGYSFTDNTWRWSELVKGWGPILLGLVAHKAANRLGINRQLSRWGIPLLRI